jgi:predicted RNase H-like HicB family nuclease
MTERFYPIVIVKQVGENCGGYAAYAPDFRGCMSLGVSPEEALHKVQDVIGEKCSELRREGKALPEPGGFAKEDDERTKLIAHIFQEHKQLKRELALQKEQLDQVKDQIKEIRHRLAQVIARQEGLAGDSRLMLEHEVFDMFYDEADVIMKRKLPN